MKILFDPLCSAGSSNGVVRKENWSTPMLIKIEASIIQQEEEILYRTLLGMDETEFRLLSGSGG
ncbi:MAG: hypothetical protein FJ348_04110 [Sphingomonadales bacterium]|nr:hypothetical protein [Sphingomonadales bacterium]